LPRSLRKNRRRILKGWRLRKLNKKNKELNYRNKKKYSKERISKKTLLDRKSCKKREIYN
jgi:hypothetical protein